jgi:hypothetical protein
MEALNMVKDIQSQFLGVSSGLHVESSGCKSLMRLSWIRGLVPTCFNRCSDAKCGYVPATELHKDLSSWRAKYCRWLARFVPFVSSICLQIRCISHMFFFVVFQRVPINRNDKPLPAVAGVPVAINSKQWCPLKADSLTWPDECGQSLFAAVCREPWRFEAMPSAWKVPVDLCVMVCPLRCGVLCVADCVFVFGTLCQHVDPTPQPDPHQIIDYLFDVLSPFWWPPIWYYIVLYAVQ